MSALATTSVCAQEMEPRAYSNAPVGFNFLIVGYGYSEGGLSVDPSLPVENAELEIHTGVLAYARVLDMGGNSGKFDVILPYSDLSGTGMVAGQFKERDVNGLGDPRFRLSINFYGAPALSMKDFVSQRQDLVIGASVQVTAPASQYDSTRAINLGTNRWSIKPDIGFSKALGALTLDLTAGATFYSDNDDYFGGHTLEQEPVYSMQTNLSYELGRGAWVALGATYYHGGRTTTDGVLSDNPLKNSRAGVILALPMDRYNSVKFTFSNGVSTRTGTDFTIYGIAWQYRWGEGY